MKQYNANDGMVRLVPDEGKMLYDTKTKTTRREAVCEVRDIECFVEVDAE